MKKNKATSTSCTNATTFKKQYWITLQPSGFDAIHTTNKQQFQIFYRDNQSHRNEPLMPTGHQDFFTIFLDISPESFSVTENLGNVDRPGMIHFIAPGTILSNKTDINKRDGYVCRFTSDFFKLHTRTYNTLFHYPLFNASSNVSIALDTVQTAYFYTLFQEMEQEYHTHHTSKAGLISALLTVLLEKARQLVTSDIKGGLIESTNAGIRLSKAFIQLIETDFQPIKNLHTIEVKSLGEYASLLHVTQNHLNDTIKVVLGKTPGELIRERILTEASQLLLNTQLDIIEIGFLLKFEDPSYFSRFFKRYTGLAPRQYRKEILI